MKVTVNNQIVETLAENLQQLTEQLTLPAAGVAVAVNNRMIPRTEWAQQLIHEGDSIVIIKAVCGG